MLKHLSARGRNLVAGSLAGLVIGMIASAVAWQRPTLIERGEAWTYDQRVQSTTHRASASSDIVIIEISEADINNVENELGITWPWPRELFGDLATYANHAGAKVTVFDWLFQDRGQYSVADAETFATALRTGPTVVGMALTPTAVVTRTREGAWAAKLATFPTIGAARAVALKLSAWNVESFALPVSGSFELWFGGKASSAAVDKLRDRLGGVDELQELFAGAGATPPRQLTAAELGDDVTVQSLVTARDGLDLHGAMPRADFMDPPLAVIAAAPTHMGGVYQFPDEDSTMRRHAPLVSSGDHAFPSLALAAYLVAHPKAKLNLTNRELTIDNHTFDLDERGRFIMRFYGMPIYQRIGAYDILRSQQQLDEGKPPVIDPARLKGKYVFVSAVAEALRDLRSTPISNHQLGSEIQANALDNLESGTFIHRTSPILDAIITLLACVLTGLLVVLIWTFIHRAGLALVAIASLTGLALIGYVYLARALLGHSNLWIAVAVPSSGVFITSFTALLVVSALERRGKRFVQEALGRYTSPALVRELIEHPEHLSLEWGDRRPMSVFFSDIAGFTTISESLSPEDLVALLNDYLTHMTDLVLEHGGVVDKYIGDAVMAFWGAPIPAADHAKQSVLCAIAMRAKCDELRATWQTKYGHAVYARAGINSGDAVVGNMGSRHKYNYTVMGDMVNLASRLEGANKAYGTYLMISEATCDHVRNVVDVRELDLIAVKGKELPVRIFEVLDRIGVTSASRIASARAFEAGLADYRARRFAEAITRFQDVLRDAPDDAPSQAYLRRCHDFIAEPPPPDWDGVWRMTEK